MVSLTLGQAAVFPMPPEPEAWKLTVMLAVVWGIGLVAVGKLLWNCAWPGKQPVMWSMAFAVAAIVLLLAVGGGLQMRAPVTSSASRTTGIGAILCVHAIVMNVVVTMLIAERKSVGARVFLSMAGLVLTAAWLFNMTLRFADARVVARHMQCRVNAKGLGEAILKSAAEAKAFPAPVVVENDVERSWRVELLPYLGGKSIRSRYLAAQPWDNAANFPVAITKEPSFACPCNDDARDAEGRIFTAFAAVTGPGTIWSAPIRAGFPSVPDGASQTLMLVEAAGQRIVWTEPRDVDVSRQSMGVNLPGPKWGESPGLASGYHTGGCHAVMADGSVRFISQNINKTTLQALTTAAGSDVPGEF